MRAFLEVTCIFAACMAASISTVLSDPMALQCNECLGKNQKTCLNPTSVSCNSTCVTISELDAFSDKAYPTYYQTCMKLPEEACSLKMRLSSQDCLNLRVSFDCCSNENNCNNARYQRQPENLPPNGMKCPVCCKENSTEPCEPGTATMDCRANEKDCVTFVGILQTPDNTDRQYSFRGCINKDGCKNGFSALYGLSATGDYILDCKAALQPEGSFTDSP